jgi:hypothetical protein
MVERRAERPPSRLDHAAARVILEADTLAVTSEDAKLAAQGDLPVMEGTTDSEGAPAQGGASET